MNVDTGQKVGEGQVHEVCDRKGVGRPAYKLLKITPNLARNLVTQPQR